MPDLVALDGKKGHHQMNFWFPDIPNVYLIFELILSTNT